MYLFLTSKLEILLRLYSPGLTRPPGYRLGDALFISSLKFTSCEDKMFLILILFILLLGYIYWRTSSSPRKSFNELELKDKYDDYIYKTLWRNYPPSNSSESSDSEDWLKSHGFIEVPLDRDLALGSNEQAIIFGVNHHMTIKRGWSLSLYYQNKVRIIQPPNGNTIFWHLPISTWPDRGSLRIPVDSPLTLKLDVISDGRALLPLRIFKFTSNYGQDHFSFKDEYRSASST